jgi:hypothetical protein
MMCFICTYEKIKTIGIPAILLKFLTMHWKAMQVFVRPEMLLEHFGREYHVTMSQAITCLQSKYTAHSINTLFIITRLNCNKKNMPPVLEQVKCHITQAHACTHAHTRARSHSKYKIALEARLNTAR